MRKSVRRVIRDEKGAALALVLVLLVVGGLILTPLLGLMSTGLISGQVYEKKTDELYAADAGVEYAAWMVKNGTEVKPPGCPTDPTSWDCTITDVNGKTVGISIEYVGDSTYKTTSIAVTTDDSNTAAIDGSTTVEAYIEPMVLDFFAGALISMSDIWLKKGATVEGDVYYVGEITPRDFEPTGGETIRVSKDGGTYNGTMTINSNTSLNSTYIAGDLYIAAGVTLTIDGIVYVRGSVSVKKEVKDYNLGGSGSLIAEGDIDLRKASGFGAAGDSILMSLYGGINFKKGGTVEAMIYAPNGPITVDKDMTVVGSVVGASIQADKDGSFTYVPKNSSFEFFDPVTVGVKIKTYTINP
jgi:Tfp pilus assembly protein PilX